MGTCTDLNQLFTTLRGNGTYRMTVVSNQPDGIVGFCGHFPTNFSLNARRSGPGELTASSNNYLFSDRTFNTPSSGPFVGPAQGFSLYAHESVTVSVRQTGAGEYLATLNFTGGINRRFEIPCRCVGEAIVGCTNAIGNNEHAHHATYVITVGGFTADPA